MSKFSLDSDLVPYTNPIASNIKIKILHAALKNALKITCFILSSTPCKIAPIYLFIRRNAENFAFVLKKCLKREINSVKMVYRNKRIEGIIQLPPHLNPLPHGARKMNIVLAV
jgi:hypothetical protein